MTSLRDLADRALEATVVLSFSTVGPRTRSRLHRWSPIEELPRLDGKVALVTGATSGLGEATAIELARLGASVRLLARNPRKAAATVDLVRAESGNDDVSSGIADLARLDDVRAFAAGFAAQHDRLDVLVHCAGALVHDYDKTVDGIELTAQTHLVAPFLLTRLLEPLLEASPAPRVIWVSSGGMYSERLSLDGLEMPSEGFNGVTAYARAKRAQVALVSELASTHERIAFHAMHPGWVDTPGVEAALPRFHRVLGPILRSPREGADTIVWLAAAAEQAAHSGSFWLDRRRRATHRFPITERPGEAVAASGLINWCEARADLH